jgi:hypothetical protein
MATAERECPLVMTPSLLLRRLMKRRGGAYAIELIQQLVQQDPVHVCHDGVTGRGVFLIL